MAMMKVKYDFVLFFVVFILMKIPILARGEKYAGESD